MTILDHRWVLVDKHTHSCGYPLRGEIAGHSYCFLDDFILLTWFYFHVSSISGKWGSHVSIQSEWTDNTYSNNWLMNVIEAHGHIEREMGHGKEKNFPLWSEPQRHPPPHKGANDVSPKPVHILNTRVGLFHIRKYPPCVGGVQISNNCHHSHQMLSTFYTSDVVLHTL